MTEIQCPSCGASTGHYDLRGPLDRAVRALDKKHPLLSVILMEHPLLSVILMAAIDIARADGKLTPAQVDTIACLERVDTGIAYMRISHVVHQEHNIHLRSSNGVFLKVAPSGYPIALEDDTDENHEFSLTSDGTPDEAPLGVPTCGVPHCGCKKFTPVTFPCAACGHRRGDHRENKGCFFCRCNKYVPSFPVGSVEATTLTTKDGEKLYRLEGNLYTIEQLPTQACSPAEQIPTITASHYNPERGVNLLYAERDVWVRLDEVLIHIDGIDVHGFSGMYWRSLTRVIANNCTVESWEAERLLQAIAVRTCKAEERL